MKSLPLLGLASTLLLFTGCTNGDQAETQTVDTNATDNESDIVTIEAELEVFDFENAVNEADLISQVEIVDVLEEIDDPSPKTIFRAKVVENLKGSSETTEILVMQQGNSTNVFNDNLLFEQGENYILFLADTEGLDLENSYYILGEETGMYKLTDQSLAVKLALRDEALEEIEVSLEEIDIPDGEFVSFSEQNKGMNMEETEKDIQILQAEELKSVIKEVSEEGQ